jgi:hypothetical protein
LILDIHTEILRPKSIVAPKVQAVVVEKVVTDASSESDQEKYTEEYEHIEPSDWRASAKMGRQPSSTEPAVDAILGDRAPSKILAGLEAEARANPRPFKLDGKTLPLVLQRMLPDLLADEPPFLWSEPGETADDRLVKAGCSSSKCRNCKILSPSVMDRRRS